MKKLYLISIGVVCIISCGTENSNAILGEWRCVKRVLFNPVNREFNDTSLILRFSSNGSVEAFVGDEKNENMYFINNDTLIIDQDKYVIKKLDTDSLIIKQVVGFPIEKEFHFKRGG